MYLYKKTLSISITMCRNPFPLREKCPNTEFFLIRISRIWTEYDDLLRKPPYSVRMRKNTDQKKLRIWTLFTQCSS